MISMIFKVRKTFSTYLLLITKKSINLKEILKRIQIINSQIKQLFEINK